MFNMSHLKNESYLQYVLENKESKAGVNIVKNLGYKFK
jgi:hypothetical protein